MADDKVEDGSNRGESASPSDEYPLNGDALYEDRGEINPLLLLVLL